MNNKILMSFLMLLTVCTTLISCKDNDEQTPTVAQSVTLQMPLNLTDAVLSNATATFTNVQTSQTFTITAFAKMGNDYVATTNLPVGTYNVSVAGTITYTIAGTKTTSNVKAQTQNVTIKESGTKPGNVLLTLNTYTAKEGFVISEIFFSGNLTPEGKQYSNGQYIKVTNNTNETLYADSLAFVESAFNTALKHDYTPDIMSQAISVDALYMIPGNGKSVPVQPGKSLLLAIDGINHKEKCTTAYDLSKADFEFYDVSSNNVTDIDNPSVTNLDKWYCYTKSIFILHNRGYKGYALVKMQASKEDFLKNNFYTATYQFTFGGFNKTMKEEAYKIPNSWVVDAVNLGAKGRYEWSVFSAALDAGWTYCSEKDNDKTRYGLSVIRKMENGKYVDTNNSTNDFIPRSKASLGN